MAKLAHINPFKMNEIGAHFNSPIPSAVFDFPIPVQIRTRLADIFLLDVYTIAMRREFNRRRALSRATAHLATGLDSPLSSCGHALSIDSGNLVLGHARNGEFDCTFGAHEPNVCLCLQQLNAGDGLFFRNLEPH